MELPQNFDLDDEQHMQALMFIARNLIPEGFNYSLTVYDVIDDETRIRTVCRANSRSELVAVLRTSALDIEDEEAKMVLAHKENKVSH